MRSYPCKPEWKVVGHINNLTILCYKASFEDSHVPLAAEYSSVHVPHTTVLMCTFQIRMHLPVLFYLNKTVFLRI